MTPEQRAILSQNVITGTLPGATITSGLRSQARNTMVGGVPNSDHLTGLGVDFIPPKGISNRQAIDALKASGAPIRVALDEGDHVHVSFLDGLKAGNNYLKQGADAIRNAGRKAADILSDPVGAATSAATKPIEDLIKRAGIGALGFVMIAAVIFSLTKVDPLKLVGKFK